MTIIFTAFGYLYTHVLPFVILLGLLVFVHELGHFLVARMCGVRVEVFSLGFGKKLISWKYGDTTYCVSLIPLGGFVKMFGEQGSEHILTDEDKKVAYSHKTPWQRIAIVLAGPLMNFFFAVAVFSAIAQVGELTRAATVAAVKPGSEAARAGFKAGDKILKIESVAVRSYEEFQNILNQSKNKKVSVELSDGINPSRTTEASVGVVDNPNIFSLDSHLGHIEGLEPLALNATVAIVADSIAEKTGFRTGDEIIKINNQKISRFSDLEILFLQIAKEKKDLTVEIIRPFKSEAETAAAKDPKSTGTNLTLNLNGSQLSQVLSLRDIGIDTTELYLGAVSPGSPAALAELQPYDKIITINSTQIKKWEDVAGTIKAYDGQEALTFKILRDGTEMIKKITPKVTELTTAFGAIDKRFTVGISSLVYFAEPEIITVAANNPAEALVRGTKRTVEISIMTVMSFVKLFQGQVSPKNLGGMVSIGKAAKDSFEMGAQAFFMTMGILSVSLFILNLMPIPVLDGGHLVFYIIELIKGSPVSLRKMEIAQQVGLVLLLGLMVLAQYNDIVKFLFKS